MEVFSMVLSLLAYFFSMITAFTVLATVWIGLIGASPFQTVHLQPYPQPVIADVAAAPIAPPKIEIDAQADAAAAKAKRLTQARAHERASLAQQHQEHANFVALGYVAEPGAAFSPAFAPVYPVSAGRGAVN
jgi:hypothetical protein